jgi:cytoskeletal protein CcmA (bactofilin family)
MFSKTNNGSRGDGRSGTPGKPSAPSIVSAGLCIVGDLNSVGEIHVDGYVDGDIKCKGLLVGERAVIKGEIVAEMVSIHGTVNGHIKAQTVTLSKMARVSGDILHENLSIERGAFLEGQCKRMDEMKEPAEGRINLVAKEPGASALAIQPIDSDEKKKAMIVI